MTRFFHKPASLGAVRLCVEKSTPGHTVRKSITVYLKEAKTPRRLAAFWFRKLKEGM